MLYLTTITRHYVNTCRQLPSARRYLDNVPGLPLLNSDFVGMVSVVRTLDAPLTCRELHRILFVNLRSSLIYMSHLGTRTGQPCLNLIISAIFPFRHCHSSLTEVMFPLSMIWEHC